ncbi:DUF4124 domain-containing protein [Marinobacter nauticus]|uniref:DUF4124 domain-containing protein n=1 Tax=Marinobacter nauticus TaxID=2743 RepID=UPI000EAC1772|nr:DUF4124 domain-containing protein [Marinobacter nauticus]RKR79165.1 uncharacterized protein DUF4124 [Marinobacter nauticus]
MRFLALLLASLSFSAVAQVYKWTDENGVTHFGTQPPAGQQQEVKIRDTISSSPDQPVESDIVRRARELEVKNRQERLDNAQQRYEQRVSDIRQGYDNRPDYVCQGAKDRLKSAEERWEDQRRQGYSQSDKVYHEQRIREARRHRDNICR